MTTQLSLQQIISCDPSSPKCDTGGLAFTAWQFFKSNGVVDTLCYPFEGKESDCDNKCQMEMSGKFIKLVIFIL